MNIPECIFHKIMLYNSHPVADIVKNNVNRILSGMNGSFEENDIAYQTIYFDIKHLDRNRTDDSDIDEDDLFYSNGYNDSDDFEAETEMEIIESDDEDLYELVIKNKQTNQIKTQYTNQ